MVEHALTVEGKSVGIFPTGKRGSRTVKMGANKLAARFRVPIVMVGISGTENDLERFLETRKFPKVAVTVSEPVELGRKDLQGLQELHDQEKQRADEFHAQVYGS